LIVKSSNRAYKDAIYEQLARIGKGVASPRRLELLDLLAQAPRTVEALAREARLSLANASRHLQILRAAGLVAAEKQGQFARYRLASDEVAGFFRALRQVAESRLAEIERITRDFLGASGALEPVDREALLDRVRRGAVTVLDVRPSEEYRAGHIPGALSIPLAELEQRLAELPRDREVVAYCRGPYCVLALEAVRVLREHGLRAFRLEDGVPDWRARGFELATGEAAS
jgi:rhodanese-related sulfurtransferase/DNA-binding MarR family transcriptional regulator